MSRTRIDEAIVALTAANKSKKQVQRAHVLRAVRQLTAWLAGDKKIPARNAVNTDDDACAYCQRCFVSPIPSDRELCGGDKCVNLDVAELWPDRKRVKT